MCRAVRASPDLDHPQSQVGSREALEDLGCVCTQAESRQDLVPHDGRGGGGAGQNTRVAELGRQLADLHVVRTKVVAPLADAMSLVHGDERDLDVPQQAPEAREGEPLRCHIDDLVLAGGYPSHPAPHLIAVERGGEEGGGHAPGSEGLDLVVHQRDER